MVDKLLLGILPRILQLLTAMERILEEGEASSPFQWGKPPP